MTTASANGTAEAAGIDLGKFLELDVFPRLTAESLFTHDAHHWQKDGDKWRGGCPRHDSKSGTAFYINKTTLRWRCPACDAGGGPTQYVHFCNGGKGTPCGSEFVGVARHLAEIAGVSFPEQELSEEEQEHARRRDARRAILDAVTTYSATVLWSSKGGGARVYLHERGFTDEAIRELQLGLYLSAQDMREFLLQGEHRIQDAKTAGVLWPKLEGYILFPWADDRGQPLTIYGTWHARTPPKGTPKKIALPNPGKKEPGGPWEQTKRSPLYLDRALRAGHRDVVLVEGVTDAALAQVLGDTRVIACVAAELSRLQVATLARHKVQSVTICLDPDEGGAGGVLSCVRNLTVAGIKAQVAPQLPNGMDPDDFILAHGIDAWRKHVGRIPPRIMASNGDLAAVTAQAWKALESANDPPTLFRYGAVPARIERDDDDSPLVRSMTPDRMRHRLARDASWYAFVKRGDSEEEKLVHPPMGIVRDVLATPDPPLPVLTRVVECPIFASDGTLQTEPGYSPASKTYFVPGPGFVVPHVSPQPSMTELEEARGLLTEELIGEFPFVNGTDKAHALSALLTPFARELIQGPTPIHDFEAPGPGTGKTLLVDAVMFPALGRPATAMTEGRDEDEWRKRLLAKLMSAPAVVLIDNVRRRVDAAALASALTAYPLWEDRVLGKSEIVRVPVRCAWLLTGNNPAFSAEMTRRTVRCRLDAKMDQPWLRTGFRHPALIEWARENRGRLVWAALTLIQAWIAAGRPKGEHTLGMFESWARVMGGILDVADVRGFLGNLQEFYASADTEGAAWRGFVAAWWATMNASEVKASELYTLAMEAGMYLGDKTEQSQKVRLGQKLAEARDRVFRIEVSADDYANLRVAYAGEHRRAGVWKLDRVQV